MIARTALGSLPLGQAPLGNPQMIPAAGQRPLPPGYVTQPVSPGLALRNLGAGIRDTVMDPRLYGGAAPENPGRSILAGGRQPMGPALGSVETGDDGAMDMGLALGDIMPPRRPPPQGAAPVQAVAAAPQAGGDPNFIQASTGGIVPARGYMPPNAAQPPQGGGTDPLMQKVLSSVPQGGSALGGLTSDDKNMALLQAGLGMMASASQPGATALGSIGAGGMTGVNALQSRKKALQDAEWREFEGMMRAASLKNQIDQNQQTAGHRTATLDETRRHNQAQEIQQVRLLEAKLAAQGRPKGEGELLRRAKSLAEADPSSYSETMGEKDDRAVAQNTRKYAAQLAQRYGMNVPELGGQGAIPAFDPGDPAAAKAGIAQLPDGSQFKLGGKTYIKRGDKLQHVPEGGLQAKPGLGGGNPVSPTEQRQEFGSKLRP